MSRWILLPQVGPYLMMTRHAELPAIALYPFIMAFAFGLTLQNASDGRHFLQTISSFMSVLQTFLVLLNQVWYLISQRVAVLSARFTQRTVFR